MCTAKEFQKLVRDDPSQPPEHPTNVKQAGGHEIIGVNVERCHFGSFLG